MKISSATHDDIYAVALTMRDRDFNEFSAVASTDDRSILAKMLADRYGGRPDVMCGFSGSEPVCIGGVIEARPNVLTLLFLATDAFPRVAVSATRFIRNELFPRVKRAGVHRIEAVSMVGHRDAHRWLLALGLTQETPPMPGYGKRGEEFIQFAWVSDACKTGDRG